MFPGKPNYHKDSVTTQGTKVVVDPSLPNNVTTDMTLSMPLPIIALPKSSSHKDKKS